MTLRLKLNQSCTQHINTICDRFTQRLGRSNDSTWWHLSPLLSYPSIKITSRSYTMLVAKWGYLLSDSLFWHQVVKILNLLPVIWAGSYEDGIIAIPQYLCLVIVFSRSCWYVIYKDLQQIFSYFWPLHFTSWFSTDLGNSTLGWWQHEVCGWWHKYLITTS